MTKDPEEGYTLLYALQWQYQARDFTNLYSKLKIFSFLSGREPSDSLISESWGKVHPENQLFSKDLLNTFMEVYLTVLARITEPGTQDLMQLKQHGNETVVKLVPSLRKVKSMVDEDASSLLIDSAMRVIFRYFDKV